MVSLPLRRLHFHISSCLDHMLPCLFPLSLHPPLNLKSPKRNISHSTRINRLSGDYDNVPAPPVENPPAPAAGYGSYGTSPSSRSSPASLYYSPFPPSTRTNTTTGTYDDVPATPPASGDYGSYGSYKRDEAKAAEDEVKV